MELPSFFYCRGFKQQSKQPQIVNVVQNQVQLIFKVLHKNIWDPSSHLEP